ncbi:MAG: galactose-1-phosphate uridylyltransferase, partial [Candidatus Kryptoniota bacterium]
TRDWVIITPERARRPDQFAKSNNETLPLVPYMPDCPFCRGNEHMTMDEILKIDGSDGWNVRVIPNKFPALTVNGERIHRVDGIYRSITAVGYHEVIVEHPLHNTTLALMSAEGISKVLTAYKRRYSVIRRDPRIEAIIIFKNHGEEAGTSIIHPHSQLVATPIVPYQVRSRIDEAIRYFDDTGECVGCRTVEDELRAKERVIHETEHFVCFIPYAALSPFHTWIFPKHHSCSFDAITDEELNDLAVMMKIVLAKLYSGLNNPSYNYSIRSMPTREQQAEYFHWYLSIIPRVSRTAGFELGSGMFINTAVPEESARFLREVRIND